MGEFDDLIDDENSVSFDDEPNETIATETEEVPKLWRKSLLKLKIMNYLTR